MNKMGGGSVPEDVEAKWEKGDKGEGVKRDGR